MYPPTLTMMFATDSVSIRFNPRDDMLEWQLIKSRFRERHVYPEIDNPSIGAPANDVSGIYIWSQNIAVRASVGIEGVT